MELEVDVEEGHGLAEELEAREDEGGLVRVRVWVWVGVRVGLGLGLGLGLELGLGLGLVTFMAMSWKRNSSLPSGASCPKALLGSSDALQQRWGERGVRVGVRVRARARARVRVRLGVGLRLGLWFAPCSRRSRARTSGVAGRPWLSTWESAARYLRT